MRRIVRTGDNTDHGGAVVDFIPHTNLNGTPMAGKGNMVFSPLCKGAFPIIERK